MTLLALTNQSLMACKDKTYGQLNPPAEITGIAEIVTDAGRTLILKTDGILV